MRRLTFFLLWVFVFSIPWESFIRLPGIGTFSRLLGLLVISSGLAAIAIDGRIRRPRIVTTLALGFTLVNALSLFWTISYDATISRVLTYAQLLGFLSVVWEFARRPEDSETLMFAYCLGAYVSIADALSSFAVGAWQVNFRYSASNTNPNMFGLVLALGIPMAWWLFLTRRAIIRVIAAVYVPLAALGIILTASRTAFLAALIAASVIPLTLWRKSLLSWVTAVWIVLGAVGFTVVMVPQNNWDRIFTLQQELTSGTMGGRSPIWATGWNVFLNRPMLGVGSGAFEDSVRQQLGVTAAAHNVLIAVLTEQGIVGFSIFAALLCACAWRVATLPPPLRSVWTIIATIWLVGSMTTSWQYGKVTWLLFALLATQAAAHGNRSGGADHGDHAINRKSQMITPALPTRRAS